MLRALEPSHNASMSLARQLAPFAISAALVFPALAQTDSHRVASITSAVRSNDFDTALGLLAAALKQSPGDPQLWTLQGIALSGEKRLKEAAAAFHTALKIAPDYVPALEGAAQLEYEADSQRAVPLLDHLLRLRPDDPTSHAMLAVLAYRRGDCSVAVPHFEKSRVLVDSQPATLQELGSCLVKLEEPQKALPIFQKALELQPEDAGARYRLAAVQTMAERPNDALETLSPFLQADQPDARALQLAASAYEASGDTPHAVQALRQAIVLEPRNVDLYLDFANISMTHQSYQVGIDMTNVGLHLQPEAAPLYVVRGILYVQLAKFDEAEADFDKANSLDPEQAVGSAAQGLEAVQRNDPDRALAKVRAKLASAPNDAFLLYLQADILSQKGPDPGSKEFQTALASARKAVSLQPKMAAAHDVLAKLYMQQGLNQAAIEQSRKALENDPKDQTAVYRLIQALRKTQQPAEIPELLKRLAELRAESTDEEREHNRYKLVEESSSANAAAQP
jgi:tetratricopeptide (TPR) repeat protein